MPDDQGGAGLCGDLTGTFRGKAPPYAPLPQSLGDTGNGHLRWRQGQKEELDLIAFPLPFGDYPGIGSSGKGGLKGEADAEPGIRVDLLPCPFRISCVLAISSGVTVVRMRSMLSITC